MISRADAFLFVMSVDKEIAETLGEEPLVHEMLASPKAEPGARPRTTNAQSKSGKWRALQTRDGSWKVVQARGSRLLRTASGRYQTKAEAVIAARKLSREGYTASVSPADGEVTVVGPKFAAEDVFVEGFEPVEWASRPHHDSH